MARVPGAAFAAVVVLSAASLLPAVALAPAAAAADSTVTAFYDMDEPAGATVMQDSSGNGLDGVIDPAGVQTGVGYDGATGYKWAWRSPTAPPAAPERVIQVPDDINLEPGDQAFTVELRYRTHAKFGNIVQKGQSQTAGGQWKIQNPQGKPSCLFKGSSGRVSTKSPTTFIDDEWHVLTCTLDAQGVTLYVDGVELNHKNGAAGTVDNALPMTVGGKVDCDQVEVTCDYFSGQIDYLKITKGEAPPPPGDVALVGAAAAQSGGKSVSVTLPATAAGQQMVAVLSRANDNSTLTTPSGWAALTAASQGSLYSTAWTRTASAADVGGTLKITLTANAKMTLSVAVYANAGAAAPWAVATDGVSHTTRVTPSVNAPNGAWLVSYWADRSSSTTSWSTSGATERADICATGGGRVCSLLADSAGPLPAGAAGSLEASTDVASSAAVMWSIIIPDA